MFFFSSSLLNKQNTDSLKKENCCLLTIYAAKLTSPICFLSDMQNSIGIHLDFRTVIPTLTVVLPIGAADGPWFIPTSVLHTIYIIKPLFIQNLPIASVTKHICTTVATQLRLYINHILVFLQCLRLRSTTRQLPKYRSLFTDSLRMRGPSKHRELPNVALLLSLQLLQLDADDGECSHQTCSHSTAISCLREIIFVFLKYTVNLLNPGSQINAGLQ